MISHLSQQNSNETPAQNQLLKEQQLGWKSTLRRTLGGSNAFESLETCQLARGYTEPTLMEITPK
jgi:FtsZ-binding cell division protein ZapB